MNKRAVYQRGMRVKAKPPRFIVLGGLPGVGKSSLARALCEALPAVQLRIDSIEQALREARPGAAIEDAGYRVAYALAHDNLSRGLSVVADSVNPLVCTRDAYRAVARRAGVRAIEVQIVCSSVAVHAERVRTRASDIPGLTLPSWPEVCAREYEPWAAELTIDTAHRTLAQSSAELLAALHALA